MIVNKHKYIRKEKYTLDEILPKIKPKAVEELDGDPIKLYSARYMLFKKKGTTCVRCGLEGQYFFKERAKSLPGEPIVWHLNLYGIDPQGNEVMFTKDHILPKILGGKDKLDNFQTMCQVCNSDKGCIPENGHIMSGILSNEHGIWKVLDGKSKAKTTLSIDEYSNDLKNNTIVDYEIIPDPTNSTSRIAKIITKENNKETIINMENKSETMDKTIIPESFDNIVAISTSLPRMVLHVEMAGTNSLLGKLVEELQNKNCLKDIGTLHFTEIVFVIKNAHPTLNIYNEINMVRDTFKINEKRITVFIK